MQKGTGRRLLDVDRSLRSDCGCSRSATLENMEIPQEWIPSRWSDFQFWSDKFRELEEKVRLFLMLPKTVGQAENILEFVKCAGCSMGSAFIGILALLSKRERSKRTSA